MPELRHAQFPVFFRIPAPGDIENIAGIGQFDDLFFQGPAFGPSGNHFRQVRHGVAPFFLGTGPAIVPAHVFMGLLHHGFGGIQADPFAESPDDRHQGTGFNNALIDEGDGGCFHENSF